MIILGSYSQNKISFRSSGKPKNQTKSGLVCKTVLYGSNFVFHRANRSNGEKLKAEIWMVGWLLWV